MRVTVSKQGRGRANLTSLRALCRRRQGSLHPPVQQNLSILPGENSGEVCDVLR